jgi:hypothetical protein
VSSDNDNVVSIGNDFRNYDRRFWGWRDRARAAREDELSSHSKSWFLPGNTPLVPDTVASFQLHGESEADKARRTRRNIARLEEKLGRRPRTGW